MAHFKLQALKEIGNIKYAVFGYIHQVQHELFPNNDINPYYTIPELVIFLCLSYFYVTDYFDDANCKSNVKLSNNNKTITVITNNVVKHHCVNWVNSTDNKIVKWKLKCGTFEKSTNIYMVESMNSKCWTFISGGIIRRPYRSLSRLPGLSGSAYGFASDDEVEIILDLVEAKLKYVINGKYRDIIDENLPKNNQTKYQLAVFLNEPGSSITLLNYSEHYKISVE